MRSVLDRCATIALLLSTSPTLAGIAGVSFTGFADEAPLTAAFAPGGDPTTLFVGLRSGEITALDTTTGMWASQPLVQVAGVDETGEGGLLGMAFHPDFQTNGKLYVHATIDPGDANPGIFDPFVSTIREYTIDPGGAAPTVRTILEVPQPTAFHNGGWIGFNPAASGAERSQLYITIGDGDAPSTGQTITGDLLGNVLRLDIDGDDFPLDSDRNYAIPSTNPFVGQSGEDEIFAYGLRNPFRAGFDRLTGDLWIGDVGDGLREEINVIRSGEGGGQNFGWDACEGLLASGACDALKASATVVDPVYDYSHPGNGPSPPNFEGVSVTGGLVYRGPDPELNGTYLFGDVFAPLSRYWSLDAADPLGSVQDIDGQLLLDGFTIGGPIGFVEDASGNVYILSLGGSIYRIETDTLVDGDFNADGVVDIADYTTWRDGLGGDYMQADYGVWQMNFGRSASDPAAASALPEPSAVLLCLIAFGCCRRR